MGRWRKCHDMLPSNGRGGVASLTSWKLLHIYQLPFVSRGNRLNRLGGGVLRWAISLWLKIIIKYQRNSDVLRLWIILVTLVPYGSGQRGLNVTCKKYVYGPGMHGNYFALKLLRTKFFSENILRKKKKIRPKPKKTLKKCLRQQRDNLLFI